MSRRKLKGWFIKDIRQVADDLIVIRLKDGRKLQIKSSVADWEYNTKMTVGRYEEDKNV